MLRLIFHPAVGPVLALLFFILKLARVGDFAGFPWWGLSLIAVNRPLFLGLTNCLIWISREISSAKWRKKAAVGDRAGFKNLGGGFTIGEIASIDTTAKTALLRTSSFSKSVPLKELYPREVCRY